MVQRIRHRNHDDVRLGVVLKTVLPVLPIARRGDDLGLLGVRDPDDLKLVGMFLRVFGIGTAAVSGPEDDCTQFLHFLRRFPYSTSLSTALAMSPGRSFPPSRSIT